MFIIGKSIKSNFILVVISNLFQLLISFVITILLTNYLNIKDYASYILFLSIFGYLNIVIIPFLSPFFNREGALEYKKDNNFGESFKTVYYYFLIIIALVLVLIFATKDQIFLKININKELLLLAIIYCTINFFLTSLKIASRIKNDFKNYSFLLFFEKFSFFLSIIILIKFNLLEKYLIEILIFCAMAVTIFFLIKFKNILFIKYKHLNTAEYIRTLKPILSSAIVFSFLSFDFLVIIAGTLFFKNDIVAYLGIAHFIVNLLYAPVFWIEQLLNPSINIIFNEKNFFKKKEILNDKAYYYSICMVFLVLISILLINETKILNLLNTEFNEGKFYICLILITLINRFFDTFFGIIIQAIKKEKFFFYISIPRFIIFLVIGIAFKNLDYLIISFVLFNLVQNVASYIYLKKKTTIMNYKLIYVFSLEFFLLAFITFENYFILTIFILINLPIVLYVIIKNLKNNINFLLKY